MKVFTCKSLAQQIFPYLQYATPAAFQDTKFCTLLIIDNGCNGSNDYSLGK